jgi:hypothetical protein
MGVAGSKSTVFVCPFTLSLNIAIQMDFEFDDENIKIPAHIICTIQSIVCENRRMMSLCMKSASIRMKTAGEALKFIRI